MAKAHQPPPATTEQTYYVTHHALDRIRERSEPAAHLENYALCRVIDDAVIKAARDSGNIYEVEDQNEPGELVHIQAEHMDGLTLRGPVFALLKDNALENSPYKKAVVTILSEHMAQKYYGKYLKANGFSNTMADKLKRLDIVPTKTPSKSTSKPEPSYIILSFNEGQASVELRGNQQQVTEWLIDHPRADADVLRCYPVKVKVTVELE